MLDRGKSTCKKTQWEFVAAFPREPSVGRGFNNYDCQPPPILPLQGYVETLPHFASVEQAGSCPTTTSQGLSFPYPHSLLVACSAHIGCSSRAEF